MEDASDGSGGGASRDGPRSGRSCREKWDPLGLCALVRDDDWPEDEYDSYAIVLASKLKRSNDRAVIVGYFTTRLVDKDTVISPAWITRCEAAGDALIEWYAQSNAPR